MQSQLSCNFQLDYLQDIGQDVAAAAAAAAAAASAAAAATAAAAAETEAEADRHIVQMQLQSF